MFVSIVVPLDQPEAFKALQLRIVKAPVLRFSSVNAPEHFIEAFPNRCGMLAIGYLPLPWLQLSVIPAVIPVIPGRCHLKRGNKKK